MQLLIMALLPIYIICMLQYDHASVNLSLWLPLLATTVDKNTVITVHHYCICRIHVRVQSNPSNFES
jgi:hypothetical protein